MRKPRKRRVSRRAWLVHRLEYLGLRLAAAMIRALPIATSAAICGKIWRYAALFNVRHRRVLANLELALPGLEPAECKRIASAQWENLGRVFAETFQIDRIAADPDRVSLVLDPALEARLAEHEGGVSFVSAHMANWEVTGFAAMRLRNVAGLYQRLSNPVADRYLAGLRLNAFPGGVFSKGRRTPARIMRWVRAGNGSAMLGDTYERRGIEATFFGIETRVNPFPAMLARRMNVPLVAATTTRLSGSRFRVEAVQLAVPQTEDVTADVAAATQAVLDHFETAIRQRPEEWMWVLNVWRRALKKKNIVPEQVGP